VRHQTEKYLFSIPLVGNQNEIPADFIIDPDIDLLFLFYSSKMVIYDLKEVSASKALTYMNVTFENYTESLGCASILSEHSIKDKIVKFLFIFTKVLTFFLRFMLLINNA